MLPAFCGRYPKNIFQKNSLDLVKLQIEIIQCEYFFKKLLLLILICNNSFGQDDCPPCEIIANPGLEITKSNSKWPELKKMVLLE